MPSPNGYTGVYTRTPFPKHDTYCNPHPHRRVLSQKVFTKYRKDHCMCTTCLRSGWRGILENGKKVLLQLDSLNIWPVANEDDKQTKRSPGSVGLSGRLRRLWNFIRLQLHLHFGEQSSTATHCTRMHLGSIAEPRFNQPCTHKHVKPTEHPPSPEVRVEQPGPGHCFGQNEARNRVGELLGAKDRIALSSTCTRYRKDWSQEWPESIWHGATYPPTCATRGDVCGKGTCGTRPTCHCVHCDKSFCRPHCAEHLCSSENMPSTFGKEFVCKDCTPKVDACQHSNKGCATCDEIQYFKIDLMKCAEASEQDEIIGRAKDVCKSIDVMVGHTARITNQERYWPDMLETLKKNLDYKQVCVGACVCACVCACACDCVCA